MARPDGSRWALALLCVLAGGATAYCAELEGCLKLAVTPGGEATLTNGCSSRLNFIYCIDNPGSARACAKAPSGITTLNPGTSAGLASYTGDGGGQVHWAVCVYPEAPVGWQPGPASPYACKKTCVMC